MPDWMGPPVGALPGVVSLEVVLAKTDDVAVAVTRASAYPTGLEFDLVTIGGPGARGLDPLLFEGRMHHRRGDGGALPPEMLRFGVEYPDGRRATNVGTHPFALLDEDEDEDGPPSPKAPVLIEHGGGGGGGNWRQSMWLWPLPGQGTLTLACEWPAVGIPLTRHAVDARPLFDAARRAQTLFSFPEPPEGEIPASPAIW